MTTKFALLKDAAGLRDAGELEAALKLAQQHVAGAPEDPFGWEFLGTLLTSLDRHDDALNSYGEAIRRATTSPNTRPSTSLSAGSPWYSRAVEYTRVGRRTEAIADFAEAIGRAPEWANILASDAQVQALCGDDELRRLIEDGRVDAHQLVLSDREAALREERDAATELFDMSKQFASPEVVKRVQGIVANVFEGLTARSTGEDAAQLLRGALARLAEVLASHLPDSPETRVTQRAGHNLFHVALIYGLHDLIDRAIEEDPWYVVP